MKRFKKILMLVFCTVVVFSLSVVEPVQAKVKMPGKSEKLVQRMTDYTTVLILVDSSKSWEKVPMNNDTYMGAIGLTTIVDSCKSGGKKSVWCSEKKIRSYCNDFFGKSGYKDLTTNDWFYKSGGKYASNVETMAPLFPTNDTITKIKKVKPGIYDVYVDNYVEGCQFIFEDKKEKDRQQIGESVIRIKESKKSSYGYITIGMKYRRTNKNFWSKY